MTRQTHPLVGYRIKINRAQSARERGRGEWGDHWEWRVMYYDIECGMDLECPSWEQAMERSWSLLVSKEEQNQRNEQGQDRQDRIERRPSFWKRALGL